MVTRGSLGRIGIVLAGAVVATVVGVGLFAFVPIFTALGVLEVLLVVAVVAGGTAAAGRFAASAFPDYDVAEVEVDDVITRDGSGGPVPVGGGGVSADDVVEQIERADADDSARALVVKLNTPGGAVVPSEDIRRAAADFDGPTVAYAEDIAASGGYWIASGCDEFHAREASIVGSIGVNGTQFGVTDLAEKAGVEYRRFVAGEYKDTPSSWRDLSEEEVEYFQGFLDDYYDLFVETVAEGRELDAEFVRDTEARVYLGHEAGEKGLVDTVGPRAEMEDRLAERVGVDEITVEQFEPDRGLSEKVSVGARSVARAFGAGVASVLTDDDVPVRARL
ncbi:MAG: signal peptide peptidase SppA [Haloarculaceae archaeon]